MQSIFSPAQDHLGGEPPLLSDRGAQPTALRKGEGYGGPRCPGLEASPEGVNHPPVRPRIGPASRSHGRARRPGFCFLDMQGAGVSRNRRISAEMASQTTWDAFSGDGRGGEVGANIESCHKPPVPYSPCQSIGDAISNTANREIILSNFMLYSDKPCGIIASRLCRA